jgi:hypothetical protein
MVRYVRAGDREVLRGIYAAVRNSVWGTVPPRIRDMQLQRQTDSFRLTFVCEHRQDDIDFAWNGTVAGHANGKLEFLFDGKARSTFLRNRIGFCVLHPMRECSGQPCTIETTSGTITKGRFPDLISPHQPFLNIRSIRHVATPGLDAEVRLEGDTFEMEDHRNWTDANFKTYCTPLANPYPVKIPAGTQISQSVTLTLTGKPQSPSIRRKDVVDIRITGDELPMPKIGFCYSTVKPDQIARIRKLAASHIRVDIRPDRPNWKDTLARAAEIGVPLEIALFGPVPDLPDLKIARILVFDPAHARTRKGTQVLIGTNDYFTELNRNRPPRDVGDGTCYSINPQVHAFDDATLVENLQAQADTVRTARSFAGDRWIAVTPVTLRPRFIPANGQPVPPDPRQALGLASAWALGSMKYLAESGANSITYFELAGPGGILDFPVERAFSLARGADRIVRSESDDPLRVECAVFGRGRDRQIIVANMTSRPQRARVEGKTLELRAWQTESVAAPV